MKLIVPVFVLLFQLGLGKASGQGITIHEKDCILKSIFKKIEQQSKYKFVYQEDVYKNARLVTINVTNASLREVLLICQDGQPFSFEVNHTTKKITLKRIADPGSNLHSPILRLIDITGKVVNDSDNPIEGATVKVDGTSYYTATDEQGNFTLKDVDSNAFLLITSVGFENKKIKINGNGDMLIKLGVSRKMLEDIIVIPYGITSRRLNTGSVADIIGKNLRYISWGNPIAILAGRASGLLITQYNGLSGTSIGLQIRGQSSIGVQPGKANNNSPLIIIDGVPFAPNNNNIQAIPSGSLFGIQGRSPFTILNANDIESIEVLKDADATAIYGSRGGNGVILITTRQGRAVTPVFFVDVYGGLSTISESTRMMNTQQYINMRKEAFINDGIIPDSNNAGDLKIWQPDRYIDFHKLLIGNTGKLSDYQITIQGGYKNTRYSLGFNNHHETTVYPGNIGEKRRSIHLHIGNHFLKNKFIGDFLLSYTNGESNLIATDLTQGILLPPNAPNPYNNFNQLYWSQDVNYKDNPMAYLKQKYTSTLGSILLSYIAKLSLSKNINIKMILGSNSIWLSENSIKPIVSHNPYVGSIPKGSAYFGNNEYKSWIFEPHLEWYTRIGNGKLTFLIGGSWQQLKNENLGIKAEGYSNDAMLLDTSAAETVDLDSNKTDYKYQGLFVRLNYNWESKYLINISGRREGSTRFGPASKFGYFGAIGMSWIFSDEPFLAGLYSILNFGKLRCSYGVTGNDQIGENKFVDNWSSSTTSVMGTIPVYPTSIADPAYKWEIIKKREYAIELGFLNNRLFFTTSYFNNRTSNQFISYALPPTTGFNKVAVTNWPVVVRNSGLEFSLSFKNKDESAKGIYWSCEANLTIPRNKLVSFPGLNKSRYAKALVEGQSLTVQRGYEYEGVNTVSGLFKFKDQNNDGAIDFPGDYINLGNLDPKAYGGLLNTVSFKGMRLQVFIEGRQQTGYSLLYAVYSAASPGAPMRNQPIAVLDRWQRQGDHATYQKYSTGENTETKAAIKNILQSGGRLDNASFIRLKTVTLSCKLPANWLSNLHVKGGSVYLQGYNLATFSSYKGLDPEMQTMNTLPSVRTITAGIQLSF